MMTMMINDKIFVLTIATRTAITINQIMIHVILVIFVLPTSSRNISNKSLITLHLSLRTFVR